MASSSTAQAQDSLDGFMAGDLRLMRQQTNFHVPPVLNNKGFEKRIHKPIANMAVDRLQDVNMPGQWRHSPRFHTRTDMREARASEMRPHASYDVDGDGFVGQNDYSISLKHDLGQQGMLTGGQRDSAIAETCYLTGSRLHDDEMGGNTRVRRIMKSLREEPELRDTVKREGRLRAAEMATASLKMKSSHQLKECLALPQRAVPAEENGPVYTRTMLLERRKQENAAREESARQAHLRMTGQLSW